jgi:hypothetical protein
VEGLIERFIIWRYASVGKAWGEWESYAFMASEHEANPLHGALARWERVYDWLGYDTVPRKVWVEAGGFGQAYDAYLRKVTVAINP